MWCNFLVVRVSSAVKRTFSRSKHVLLLFFGESTMDSKESTTIQLIVEKADLMEREERYMYGDLVSLCSHMTSQLLILLLSAHVFSYYL